MIEQIRRLGGKFVIMYMMWIGNIQAAFETPLSKTYTPMDRFKPGLEWKRQGEQADLREVFPEALHSDFNSTFLQSTVSLHFFPSTYL